jgi:hypothetical protein
MADRLLRERRKHFRNKAKPQRALPVEWRLVDDQHWHRGRTRDVGVGGGFVVIDEHSVRAPVGAEIRLRVKLPSGAQVELPGAVRRVVSAADDLNGESGMGVQFGAVDIDALLELNEFISAES